MSRAIVNQAYPLRALAGDGSEVLFPRTTIRDSDGVVVTTVNLVHIDDGLYGADWTPDEADEFSAVTIFYSDSGHTTLADFDREGESISAIDASVTLVQSVAATILPVSSSSSISMFRGDSRVVQYAVSAMNLAGVTALLDLTGAAIMLSIRKRGSSAYLLQVPGVIVDAEEGVVSFTFEPGDTSDKSPATYTYDVQVTDSGGNIYTVIRDTFELKEDVTLP